MPRLVKAARKPFMQDCVGEQRLQRPDGTSVETAGKYGETFVKVIARGTIGWKMLKNVEDCPSWEKKIKYKKGALVETVGENEEKVLYCHKQAQPTNLSSG